MLRQDTHSSAFQGVPDIAVKVIVTGQEEAARDGKGDRRYAAEDVIIRVLVQFSVRSHIEQSARGIVRAGTKGITVGEEPSGNRLSEHDGRDASSEKEGVLDSVNVGFVARKRLHAATCPDIPHFGGGITGTRDKNVLVRRKGETIERQ